MAGIARSRAPEDEATMVQAGDGPQHDVPRGGHRAATDL